MTNHIKNTPGYPTDKPCDRCGAKPAYIEPRFGYVACAECHKIPPVDFQKEKNKC